MIIHQRPNPENMQLADLVSLLEMNNRAYRDNGYPDMGDDVYDLYLSELKKRVPDHPFLLNVEAETEGTLGEPVRHSSPLLSTEKLHPVEVLSSF